MHPTTEQLLAIRDGIAPASTHAHVDACAHCQAEVARLADMRDALRALPPVAPPPAAFAAVVAARTRARRVARGRRYGALAVAASVILAVALLLAPGPEPVPPLIPADAVVSDLSARAHELDRMLAAVEAESGILDLHTASAIIALEDQIAAVDVHLRQAAALEPHAAEDLLRQRIALVTALVDVHAAQTQYSF